MEPKEKKQGRRNTLEGDLCTTCLWRFMARRIHVYTEGQPTKTQIRALPKKECLEHGLDGGKVTSLKECSFFAAT